VREFSELSPSLTTNSNTSKEECKKRTSVVSRDILLSVFMLLKVSSELQLLCEWWEHVAKCLDESNG